MTKVAKATGLSRENLYRSLSSEYDAYLVHRPARHRCARPRTGVQTEESRKGRREGAGKKAASEMILKVCRQRDHAAPLSPMRRRPLCQVVAANLKRERKARGLSREDLATAAGLPSVTLARIERAEPHAARSMKRRSSNWPRRSASRCSSCSKADPADRSSNGRRRALVHPEGPAPIPHGAALIGIDLPSHPQYHRCTLTSAAICLPLSTLARDRLSRRLDGEISRRSDRMEIPPCHPQYDR